MRYYPLEEGGGGGGTYNLFSPEGPTASRSMSKFDSGGDLVSQEASQSTIISQFVKHLKDQ